MPQTRLDNYGATATSRWENLRLYAIHQKGVYRGMTLGLDLSDNLIINSGYAALPSTVNGTEQLVVVWESTPVGLAFIPPGAPTDYTVVGFHENREILGGVQVDYELRTGIYPDITDGIVIGWIYHPGGGVPLTTDMMVSAPKAMAAEAAASLVVSDPVNIVAPFGTRSFIETISNTDVTLTDPDWDAAKFVINQSVVNSPTAVSAHFVRQIFQFYVRGGLRPSSFEMYVNIDADPLTNLVAEVFGTDQAPVTVTGSPFPGSGTGDWEWVELEVDRNAGQFDNNLPYTLRLTHNVAVGGRIRLAAVRANFWPYPV